MQLAKLRQNRNIPLITCNPSDYADIFVCGGTHLGYLHNMGKTPNLLDRLIIRRNRTNYSTAKLIMAHSHLMQHELINLYGVPSEKSMLSIHLPILHVSTPNRKKFLQLVRDTDLKTTKLFSYFHQPDTPEKVWIY